MLNRTRQVLDQTGQSRKRKEMDSRPMPPPTKAKAVAAAATAAAAGVGSSNQILAGYLAHEFLTKGTLFGENWDAAGSELAEQKQPNQNRPGSAKPMPNGYKPPPARSYADVAQLLKGDGAHIPEVVNPTQLGQWLIKM